ncbi:hypothetical protein HPB47_020261 [Ixodes persulcatus]|uniref:Uncharacterized protein n=1 Tax=Ixodes persulcatus TaxID=34615 RepID=A0AC60QJF7_IXOPE|nr:hypothetical protein HPB47_020261 [Ixodes persulcatus]
MFGIQLLHSKRNLSNAASAAAMDTVRPPASTVLCASAAVTRTRTETPALLKRGTPDQRSAQFKQSKSTRGSKNYRERTHRSKTAQNHKTEDSVRFNRHSSKQEVGPEPSSSSKLRLQERMTDDTATGQQWLVYRAKVVAATYGAPD